jgi:hypothetical protein
MYRSIQILHVLLLLAFGAVAGAQTPLTCGIIDIDGPAKVVPGTAVVFKAKMTGLSHTGKPELRWTVSAGTISSRQGTGEISVDTAGLGGVDVIATAELLGAPLGCNGSASRTTHVELPVVTCGLPLDGYGDIAFEDEKARLDNFAIQLLNDPLLVGYILMSAGQKTFAGETTERLDRAKTYLVNVRETDPTRVVTVDCGFSQDLMIRLYIAPLDATAPVCSSYLTIPFDQIKFTKPRPKPTKKQR